MTRPTDIDLPHVAHRVRQRAPLLTLLLLLAWAAAAAAALLPARKYPVSVTVAAVPNPKLMSVGAGLSALIGPGANAGVQATPYFVARLFAMRGVLTTVAHMRPDSSATVIERLLGRSAPDIAVEAVEPAMRSVLAIDVDKQTGLVSLAVVTPDSALGRFIASNILRLAGRTYTEVLQDQAADQRGALQGRVDSATVALRRAETTLARFVGANRVYTTYAAAATERQRHERAVQNAQLVYAQAVSERDAAVARQLESPSAMVVVDPIPTDIPPAPRQLWLFLALATVGALTAGACIMAVRGDFTS